MLEYPPPTARGSQATYVVCIAMPAHMTLGSRPAHMALGSRPVHIPKTGLRNPLPGDHQETPAGSGLIVNCCTR